MKGLEHSTSELLAERVEICYGVHRANVPSRRAAAVTRPRPPGDLRAVYKPEYSASGRGAGLLYCIECGCCSGELGRGWVAFRCDDPDPDEGDEEPAVSVYCPPCAAAEFGYRPDVADTYVCAWEPIGTEAGDGPRGPLGH